MKLNIFLLLIFITLPVFALPDTHKEFIGYKHQGILYGETLPNGARDQGGGLLSNDNYGITRFTKGRKYMLWLEKIIKRDAKGLPSWEVKDVLAFDNLKKNQQFLFSYSSTCKQNGKENLDLVVMAELNQQKKAYRVLRAWRANVKKEKFESTSSKGIVCAYYEGGKSKQELLNAQN
jgi:hypothetical protein